ncbi:hypothetical protein BHE74_00019028 [Ensete ventricosum]|nr:hypothetical protein BHE74_00019028 [Ensete ventricosum]
MATEPRSGPSLASSASRSVMSSSATTDAYPAVFKIGFGHNDAAYRSVQSEIRSCRVWGHWDIDLAVACEPCNKMMLKMTA